MSEYGIELGLYRNALGGNNIIEVIKITPKTITVIGGLEKIDDWRLQEKLGFDKCLIETNCAYEPKRYKIIVKKEWTDEYYEDTIGIKINGKNMRPSYFKHNGRFCYKKLDMEKVIFFKNSEIIS